MQSPELPCAVPPAPLPRFGVVVIGRNEGVRLTRCLEALPSDAHHVVYVDSGSTDGSVERSRQRGIDVVELDPSFPFTAARARNAGLSRLLEVDPELDFVQFVDGDCELLAGWVHAGLRAIGADPRIAAVSGRLRERFREATIYNRLCDLEWDTPIGDALSCGGIALMRCAAFRAVGGFDPARIAGEEPEICFRLRSSGYRIVRIDVEMALHDAAIVRFGQWLKRSMRSGYGYADLDAVHPGMCTQQKRSILLWGFALPGAAVLTAPLTAGLSFALLSAYPAQWVRIFTRRRARGDGIEDAALYAASCVLGKIPEFAGLAKCWLVRCRGGSGLLIEYK